MLRKVIFIAYHFPPVAGSGVFRTLKFVKYLPKFGWEVTVLTPKSPIFSPIDTSLTVEIPESTRVERTKAFSKEGFVKRMLRRGTEPRWIFLPDPAVGWLPFCIFRGLRVTRQGDFDAIYATAPFYTSLVAGFVLSLVTSIPLVLDFRDPWTERDDVQYPTRLHFLIDKTLELACTRNATMIVSATPSLSERVADSCRLPKHKVRTILNGYDPADFQTSHKPHKGKAFTITHVGNLYQSRLPPVFALMGVLADLVKRRILPRREVRLKLVGSSPKNDAREYARTLGIEDLVELVAYLPYRESIEAMVNSSVLLLVNPSWSTGLEIPQKVFNYLASSRPILALIRTGDLAEVLRRFRGIWIADPGRYAELRKAVLLIYRIWKDDPANKFDRPQLSQYLRIDQARELADVLSDASS